MTVIRICLGNRRVKTCTDGQTRLRACVHFKLAFTSLSSHTFYWHHYCISRTSTAWQRH